MSQHDQISEELVKLNKEEEFEYFKKYTGSPKSLQFTKWNIDEHKRFLNAILNFDFMKPNEIVEIQKLINTDNQRQRSIDEIQTHINVYKNYCNKQRTIKPFLNNIANNTYQSYIDSLDTNLSNIPLLDSISNNINGATNSNIGGINNHIPTSSLMSAMLTSNNTSMAMPNVIASVPLPAHLQPQPSSSKNTAPHLQPTQPANPITQNIPPTTPKSPAKPSGKSRAKSKAATSTIPSIPPPLEVEYSQDTLSAAAKKNQKILSEPWSSDDQKKLEESLEKFPASRFSSVSRWQAISKDIGISPKAVALRYNQMLNNLIPKNSNNSNSNNIVDDIDDGTNNKKRKLPQGGKTAKGSAKKKEKLEGNSPDLPTYINIANQIPGTPSSTTGIGGNISNGNSILSVQINKEQTESQRSFNPSRVEELIQRNSQLLEEIKKNIMLNQSTTNESVNILKEFIDNSNNALKSSVVWSNTSNELPALPFKVNDMIIGLLNNINNTNNNTNNNGEKMSLNQLSTSPTTTSTKYSSLKKPLPKEIAEWNLVIPPENK